jgi:hypothetical protein
MSVFHVLPLLLLFTNKVLKAQRKIVGKGIFRCSKCPVCCLFSDAKLGQTLPLLVTTERHLATSGNERLKPVTEHLPQVSKRTETYQKMSEGSVQEKKLSLITLSLALSCSIK